jgi:threonine/homoserine/homoserine lactone efflux protein
MTQIQMMWGLVQAHVQSVRTSMRRDRDRGDIVTYAILTGVVAAATLVIVGILVAKAKDAANGVKTQ